MTLTSGARLGPYEILAPIGAGGMGEVYKARDTRLDRIVALKVSKSEFSERFEREARAVAALNHSNICTLHDVGPNYLVMEYVEGTLLKGPLPLDQALKYAAQICDALDAAHRKGITHRDLKPANILVTKGGIKLLDFGLAKIAHAAKPPDNATVTMALTGKNEIVGTLYYMSPEQLQAQSTGEELDARSDIFSFGVVLYEMLTGKRAFEGSSPASVIGAIMERPAPSIANVAPAALDRALQRCLAKDPEERWQSARDLKAELEWIASASSGLSAKPASMKSGRRVLSRHMLIGLNAAVVLAIAAAALLIPFRRAEPPGQPVRFVVFPPEGTDFSRTAQFALSPDGRALVFVASAAAEKPTLWVRRLDEIAPRQFAGTDDVSYPFWSPDSRWIGFFAEGKIKKIPANGGPPQIVGESPSSPRGGTWGPDGTILFGTIRGSVNRISASGGPVSQATRLDDSRQESSHRWPFFLPGGRRFLYQIRSPNTGRFGVYAGSLDGETAKLVMQSNWNGVYAPQGYLLYRAGVALMAVKSRADSLQAEGEPFTVAEHVQADAAGLPAVSVSGTGALAYASPTPRIGRLTWFNRSGNKLESVGPEGCVDPRLSPDEKRLAATCIDPRRGTYNIWLTDLARGATTPFTLNRVNQSPIWSPDGTRVEYRSLRANKGEFYMKSAAGGGSEEPVFLEDAQLAVHTVNPIATDWSPDGRYLIYSSLTSAFGYDLWLLPVTGNNRTPVAYLSAPSDQLHAAFSPDGRFVAYSSNESGRFEVYVQTFPLSDRRWQISVSGGYEPRWRRDGRELYFLSADGKLMTAPVGAAKEFEAGTPKALFQTAVRSEPNPLGWTYEPSRDGQRFLVNTPSVDTAVAPITVVLNWTAELKR